MAVSASAPAENSSIIKREQKMIAVCLISKMSIICFKIQIYNVFVFNWIVSFRRLAVDPPQRMITERALFLIASFDNNSELPVDASNQ
jgi:hypothetical protein